VAQKHLSAALFLLVVFFIDNKCILAQSEEELDKVLQKLAQNGAIVDHVAYDGKEPGFAEQYLIVDSQRELLKASSEVCIEECHRLLTDLNLKTKEILQDQSIPIGEKQNAIKRVRIESYKRMNQVNVETLGRFQTILLPHQYAAISQAAFKKEFNNYFQLNGMDAFKTLLKRMELSEAERKEAESLLKECQAEFEKELAELRKETQEKAINALPVKSRKKLHELFGEWVYFDK
jgi:hypothetical protein